MNTAKLLTVLEKSHYPFKSYPRTRCKTILYPGCSFPSQFPRTMDALATLCREAGFGIAYDCCGQPLGPYGAQKSSDRILRNLDKRLAKLGCERLVVLCPTCYEHLAGKLGCNVVTLYDVMDEILPRQAGAFEPGCLFIPCPDRDSHVFETAMCASCDMSAVTTMKKAPCCGLRADLASRGPELVEKLSGMIIEQAGGDMLYTYCASCLGQFSRMGYTSCRHTASVMLGIDEQPDSSHALLNRAKRTFDRNTNPLPQSEDAS